MAGSNSISLMRESNKFSLFVIRIRESESNKKIYFPNFMVSILEENSKLKKLERKRRELGRKFSIIFRQKFIFDAFLNFPALFSFGLAMKNSSFWLFE